MARGIHTYGVSTTTLEQENAKGNNVLVYSAPELKQFQDIQSSGNFFEQVYKSDLRKKYLSLVPFFIESRFAPKRFVLSMEYMPDIKYLKFQSLYFNGISTHYEPVRYVIPITSYDYWC